LTIGGPADPALVALCTIAVWTDLRTGKIRNILTFPMMLLGVVGAPLFAAAWWSGLAGVVVTCLLALPGWRLGGAVRAGDVKMLMAAGALMGPHDGARAVLFTYALAIPFGIAVLAVKGRLGRLIRFYREKGRLEPTVVAFAPVVAVAIACARLQSWPMLWR
jgi:prepilin signal peptidase PulO-like enzyme (type II secretory pathway)